MQCKDLGNLPILLVDDEVQLLRSASLVLRSAGFAEVLTLDDSRAVLRLLANRSIGVIVFGSDHAASVRQVTIRADSRRVSGNPGNCDDRHQRFANSGAVHAQRRERLFTKAG